MDNNKDSFELTKKSPFERNSYNNLSNSNENFFMSENFSNEFKTINFEKNRRLNDYDSNLLQEDAYKDIDDELFKLEYKISKTEEELKLIDSQIQSARDIADYSTVIELQKRKQFLDANLLDLNNKYNEKSISARITVGLTNILGENFKRNIDKIKATFRYFSEIILANIPHGFANIIELKKSLEKLENINKSVDELIAMKSPYGENIDKYEQLSKYIIKANSIQAKIAQERKYKL